MFTAKPFVLGPKERVTTNLKANNERGQVLGSISFSAQVCSAVSYERKRAEPRTTSAALFLPQSLKMNCIK